MSETINNPAYKIVNGVTYFKLKSNYPGDYTKNCGLLGEEIDGNFFFLRSNDIKDVTVSKEGVLTLTRVDSGQTLTASTFVNDYKFNYDSKTGELTVTQPDGKTQVIGGFLVGQTVSVTLDETLRGKGTATDPIGISPVEKTGTFAPAKEYIDLTECTYYRKICHMISATSLYVGDDEDGYFKWYTYETFDWVRKNKPEIQLPDEESGFYAEEVKVLPTSAETDYNSVLYVYIKKHQDFPTGADKPKGYRILTREFYDNFGLLYQYEGIKAIAAELAKEGSEWRVPSREDWAEMLNAAELCEEDRNHNNIAVNEWLGKHAGARAKSVDVWGYSGRKEEGYPVGGEDNLPETGNNTFKVFPVGYGDGSRGANDIDYDIEGFKKSTSFWSSSESDNGNGTPNVFTRKFAYDTRKVEQESSKPSSRLSLRLVKDFDFNNGTVKEFEKIHGYDIPCVLITNTDTKYSKVWTAVNIGFKGFSGVTSKEWSQATPNVRCQHKLFFVNEWTGKEWTKKLIHEGDSVVLIDGGKDASGQTIYNHEWRVYSGQSKNNFVLKDVAEADQEASGKEIKRLDERIDKEISARTEGDYFIMSALTDEINRAISAETIILSGLSAETKERIENINGITIERIIPNDDEDVKEAYKLIVSGAQHGDLIKIYKDQKIHNIQVGHMGGSVDPKTGDITDGPKENHDALQIVYKNDKGIYSLVEIDLDELFHLNAGDGIEFKDGKIHVKINDEIGVDPYLTVGVSGVTLSGVTDALSKKVDTEVIGTNGTARIFNEQDGGGAKFENNNGITSFVGVHDGTGMGSDILAQLYALKDNKGTRLNVYQDKITYTNDANAPKADDEILVGGDIKNILSGVTDLSASTIELSGAVISLRDEIQKEIKRATDAESFLSGAVETLRHDAEGSAKTLYSAITKEVADRISGDTNIANILGISGDSENGFTVEFTRPYYQKIFWPTTATTFKDFEYVPGYKEIVEYGYWDFINHKPNGVYEYIENHNEPTGDNYYQLLPGTHYICSAETFVKALQILDNVLWLLLDDTSEILSGLTSAITEIRKDVADLSGATINIESALTKEIQYRISADTIISSALSAETQYRISGDTIVSGLVYTEETRAKAKEDELHGQDIKSGPYDMTVDGIILERENGDPVGITFNGNFGTI